MTYCIDVHKTSQHGSDRQPLSAVCRPVRDLSRSIFRLRGRVSSRNPAIGGGRPARQLSATRGAIGGICASVCRNRASSNCAAPSQSKGTAQMLFRPSRECCSEELRATVSAAAVAALKATARY